MPDWLLVLIGLGAGVAVVVGALVVAFRQPTRTKRRRSWLADPSGDRDDMTGWTGWSEGSDSHHSSLGNGHGY